MHTLMLSGALLSAPLLLGACERIDPTPPAPTSTLAEPRSVAQSQQAPGAPADSLEVRGIDISLGEVQAPFHALVETAAGDDQWISAGTFVDPLTLAVPYACIDEAGEITIDLGNCEAVEVLGVVGVDEALRIALLGLATPPVGVAPLAIGEPPSPGDRLEHRFIFTNLRLPCGFVSGSHHDNITVLDVRDLEGFGLTPVIDVKFGLAGMCSPIVNGEGELVGLLDGKAAGASSLVFPAVMLAEIERHAPIPLAEFAARDRTPREAALLLRHRGARLRITGDPRDALLLQEESLREFPGDWKTLYELGVCLDMTGKPDRALGALSRSIEIEPAYAESRYSLGIIYQRKGDAAAAIPPLQKAGELDPQYTNAVAMLSAAFHGAGRLEEALRAGERAIALDDAETGHFANLCMMYDQAGQDSDMERVARLWTQAFPDDPASSQSLGEALLALEWYEDAAQAFRHAIDLGATGSRPYHMLILSLVQAGQYDQADRAVDEGFKIYPDDELLPQLRVLIARERHD